jgi:hypothetical protein
VQAGADGVADRQRLDVGPLTRRHRNSFANGRRGRY